MKKKCSYCYGLGYTGLVYNDKTNKITEATCPKCNGKGEVEIFTSSGHDVDEFYRY